MLIIKNLTKYLLGKPLFEDVSFIVYDGERVGLIGTNGAGKSTLFKMIMGLESIDSGSVDSGSGSIGYFSQEHIFDDEASIERVLELDNHPERKGFLKRVGLDSVSVETLVKTLSGGQKTRLAFAQILAGKPDILLLDEPTNHLDHEGLAWLEKLLTTFPGSTLVVSHDRKFLDAVANRILEIDPANHTFTVYHGGYSEYREQKAKGRELQDGAFRIQDRERKRLEAWLVEKRQEASVHPDPKKGRMIRAKQKYLEREIYDKAIPRPRDQKTVHDLRLGKELARAKRVVKADRVSVMLGAKQILKDVSFEIFGSDRVLLKGANGSGKTTLLKAILGQISISSGEIRVGENMRVGYFSQEHETLDRNKTVMAEFLSTPGLKLNGREPRGILGAFLFPGNMVERKVGDLSLGERVRLVFAKLTQQENQFLILDEPTNHLDIPSREVIEESLVNFSGALLVVSHDRYFVDAIHTTRVLEVRNHTIREDSNF